MSKRLLVFGPPGVGKGTHARRLACDLGVPHISTGDILRRSIAEGSALGARAAAHMNCGALVPDDIVVSMLAQRLVEADTVAGFLLDGFPRNLEQARELARLSAGLPSGADGDAVLALEAPEAVLLQRLSGRQTCGACGASFNRVTRPTRSAEVCDACGGALVTRPDDQPDAIRHRLRAYKTATAPVLELLAAGGWPIRSVESVGDVNAVYGRMRAAASDSSGGRV